MSAHGRPAINYEVLIEKLRALIYSDLFDRVGLGDKEAYRLAFIATDAAVEAMERALHVQGDRS